MKDLRKICVNATIFFLGIAFMTATSLDAGTAKLKSSPLISYDDLQEAIDAAADGDVIYIEGELTGNFIINQPKNLSLVGLESKKGLNPKPTLNGDSSGRVLTISPSAEDIQTKSFSGPLPIIFPTVNLKNLIIIGGKAETVGANFGIGGAILNINYNLNLDQVVISNNIAEFVGGGIANIYGAVTIKNSSIIGNKADGGGGVFNALGYLSIIKSQFKQNEANIGESGQFGVGGALLLTLGTTEVAHSTFSANSAYVGCGAICNTQNFKTVISHSKISNNMSPVAGGIYNSGNMLCRSVKVNYNKALGGNGGGIYNDLSSNLILVDSKVKNNWAAPNFNGGGIYNASYITDLKLKETQVKDNTPDQIYSVYGKNGKPKVVSKESEFINPFELLVALIGIKYVIPAISEEGSTALATIIPLLESLYTELVDAGYIMEAE